MAERLGKHAINLKVAGSISRPCIITLCPWARHVTLFAFGGMSLYLL